MRRHPQFRTAWRWGRIGSAVTLLLSAGPLATAAGPQFDGRGWTVGNQQRNRSHILTEYVLPGQTVQSWKELVTSTVFLQPVPLGPFVEKIRANLAQGCPSLVWNVIRQDEKTVIYEWRDSGCGGFEAQNELGRVTIEKDGLYRLAYAAKVNGPLPAERRKEWLAILGQMPLAEGTRAVLAPGGTAAPAPAGQTGPPAKKLSTDDLVAGVRRSGWPCPAGTRSEVKGQMAGPQGPLTAWVLECSNGVEYTVLVDPSGGMTSFQMPK